MPKMWPDHPGDMLIPGREEMKRKAEHDILYFHKCGDSFKGQIIKTHGIIFCGFCGSEFNEEGMKNLMKRGLIVKKKGMGSAD